MQMTQTKLPLTNNIIIPRLKGNRNGCGASRFESCRTVSRISSKYPNVCPITTKPILGSPVYRTWNVG